MTLCLLLKTTGGRRMMSEGSRAQVVEGMGVSWRKNSTCLRGAGLARGRHGA